jgi:conserved domain protein
MIKIRLLVLCVLVSTGVFAQNVGKLKNYLKENVLENVADQGFADKKLTEKGAIEAEQVLLEAWKKEVKKKYHRFWVLKNFSRDGLQMKFDYRVFGELPEDGRSLFISMHGGGNAPEALNTQQWKNQIRLYEPREGVYVAPRAPWDDWNMWFKPGLDEFFDALIQTAVVEMEVNPDKVYLLGYSAGGDGVWRMAPRMADRWAAASMMAGHPGEVSQVNLRNVPFMIWMGENDGAYDRNKLAVEKGRVMDSLQQAEPEGYIHETHIVKGKGHWMDRADTAAIAWMTKYKRNALPKKIVWRQEEVMRPFMYWLGVDLETARPGMAVVAELSGNEIKIEACDYPKLRIYLNDRMVDMDKPVKVTYKGKVLFEKKLARTAKCMARTL